MLKTIISALIVAVLVAGCAATGPTEEEQLRARVAWEHCADGMLVVTWTAARLFAENEDFVTELYSNTQPNIAKECGHGYLDSDARRRHIASSIRKLTTDPSSFILEFERREKKEGDAGTLP